DQTAPGIEERDAVIAPLLDVGGIRALHQRNEALVDDRFERIAKDLQRNRVQRLLLFHAATSMSRFLHASMVARSPGKTTVVASSCSMTAGPGNDIPGSSSLRAYIAHGTRPERSSQTARVAGLGGFLSDAASCRTIDIPAGTPALTLKFRSSTGARGLWVPYCRR